MAEEHIQQPTPRGKGRRERVEYARSRDILDVASELNMELIRSGRDYRWKEHDSMVISPDKNMWNWFSRHQGGDVISLVETMKEVNFNQAINYLNDGSFKEYKAVERAQETFSYYLEPYEQPFEAARSYLKDQRGLSDETIDFFLEKGVLAQANAKVNGSIEPVVVFKSFDFSGEMVGATLQGIEENWEKWPERGYAKNIVRNSDGITGMHVDIGQPNRLIFAESAIDLMSYYELYKDNLQDVRLVSMDGLKEGVIGRHLAQLQSDISGRPLRWSYDQLAEGLQTAIDNNFFTDGKHADWITLAVDNDEAGQNFINSLREKGAVVTEALPNLQNGQEKMDWNDALKSKSVGSEKQDISNLLSQDLPAPYLELAKKADHDYHAQVSYDTFKANRKGLSEAVQSQIKAGVLQITLSDEVYFYTLVNYTGWSHPMQQLKPKAMEGLKEHRAFFESINDTNINRFKEKGTPEQNQMYDILKGLQKELGRSDTSTVFSAEVAISAYNLNRQLDSLTAEKWGRSNSDPLGGLGRDAWNIISYPANEIITSNADYYYQLVPYHLLEYLNGKSGRVEISTETYEAILQQLRDETIIITPEVTEEDIVNPRQEIISSSEETEKPLDSRQEVALNSEQQKNERTSQYKGSLQPEAEGSTAPVSETDTFDRSVTSRPTRSSHYLNFTIKDGFKSRHTRLDHSIDKTKLAKLNRFSDTIQEAAKYYQKELANSEISYFTADGNIVQVNFLEKNFMHLTGLKFIGKNQSPEKTLSDLAAGGEISFDDIRISNSDSAFDKIKVLPELKAVLQTDSFYFDQLQNIDRYTDRFDSLIKSSDKDIMVLFKATDENGTVPASIFKSREILENELEAARRNEIIGIFRKREGVLEQIAINEEYVKDGGQEMLSILQNKQYEESDVDFESTQIDVLSAEQFTQVLDAAYNVGDPRKLGTQIPEESKEAWERYYELFDTHEGNFSAIVATAEQLELVDKDSNFYQEWAQDRIYNENYHIRLQWTEKWPEGPQLPFEESSLVSYQDFVTELYKTNQEVYQAHQESIAQANAGNPDNYVPPTKVKFDIYAPGGQVIKEGVRYDIGDETEPVSRLLGLGYRRLDGQSELAAIDEVVLSQLENQELNQEIAAEANEQSLNSKELPPKEDYSRGSFYSPNQEIKTNLAQRVEEIMAEDKTKILVASVPHIQENLSVEGNLVGTPQSNGQMLYTNREEFGQDYQLELAVHSPKAIDFLEDVQAPWTLALMRGEEKLGYLAYGSDWGNDFQIEDELKKLAKQIGVGKVPEGLYQQDEVEVVLASNQGKESSKEQQDPAISAEPFDYMNASAYDISEHAFQKIRAYTQSPEDLLEYMDFMSKFPQLSPRNVALIHEQWQGANAVATYEQWQAMGEALEIKPEDVIQTKATYTNKRTGETKEVVHQNLSVKVGEKSRITLFRPLMVRMIPVLDENGHQVKNDKGNPKYKKFSDATPQEKALVKDGKLPVRQFQERDPKTGYPRFTTYKVFELSQTTLKSESYPKAMPNRHYNFNTDQVKTKEVLEGLCDYAETIGITMMKDEAHVLGNAKGAFYSGEQLILINPDNTPGEKIATTIHELAHATLHNPKLADQYKELPKGQKEFEAEMTSHLLSKHFGLDTSEKAIDYMASWTDNLKALDDKQLADSLKRVHQTVSKMHKQIENHTKPYPLGKNRGQAPNFPKAPTKGPSR